MQSPLPTEPRIPWPLLAVAGFAAWVGAKKVVKHVPRWWLELAPFVAANDWRVKTPNWAEPIIANAARATGVPPLLLSCLIRTESAWQVQVVSHAGAIGLAQLMPATAREMGVNPHDPAQNVLGGARYLRIQLDRFQTVPHALAAYNAGPHRVAQYGGVPPFKETQAYVARILSRLAGA